MSSQAGIFFFDGRPVTKTVADAVYTALAPADTDARGDAHAAGLYMAHAATWFDDIAHGEQQPCTSPSGTTLTFDGRLDNRDDLLVRLRDRLGAERTDAALALAAYEAWGEEGLVQLIGDWSVAIWEPSSRSILLASDYAGVRPLYYHATHERVMWSSYLKPLVALADAREIDEAFVAGFLTGTKTPTRTPYLGIALVPAGRVLRFAAAGNTAHAFWSLPVHDAIRYRHESDYEEQLRVLFRASVAARLRTSAPVYAELSGGLDSSSIVCMASHLIAERAVAAPHLTSMSFGSPGHPDEKFFQLVQRFCTIESVCVNTDDFPFFDPAFIDDAFPTPWGALFEEQQRHVQRSGARVYLTGMGGDLAMGNVQDDCEQLARPLFRGEWKTAYTQALGWSKATRVPIWTMLWRGFLAGLPARLPIAARYPVSADPAVAQRYGDSLDAQFKARVGVIDPDTHFSTTWHAAPPERRKFFRALSRVLESGMFRPPERMQHLYYAHPYVHRPLVEFMLKIPADQLCRPNEPRRLMRRAFAQLLPPEIVRRRSKGSFTGEFLKTIRPAAKTLLQDSGPLQVVERGYVDDRNVRERLERITQSLDCNEPQLRQIIFLEMWLRARERG